MGSSGALTSSGPGSTFPLTHWGLGAATADPSGLMLSSQMSNGQIFYSRIWIPAGTAITNLYAGVTSAGTHDGATAGNGLGLFTDTGTFIDRTPSDNTVWTAAGWRGGALSLGTIAAQGAGRYVYAGILMVGMTVAAAYAFPSDANDWTFQITGPALTQRRTFYTGGNVAFPASVNPVTGGGGTATGYTPMIGIS